MKELQSLKKLLEENRILHPKKKAFPKDFWPRVKILAETISLQEISTFLKIDLANLKKRICAKVQSEKVTSPFIQLPMNTLGGSKKQITLMLPHNVILRIDL